MIFKGNIRLDNMEIAYKRVFYVSKSSYLLS